MSELDESVAALRIWGDTLDPDEVSNILCCQPTECFRKGQIVHGKSTGREWTKMTGGWILEATRQNPGNLDKQIRELLDKLPEDLKIWENFSALFEMDLFCGLFMRTTNDGLDISADSLRRLGERGISLGLCLYAPLDGDDVEAPASE